MDKYEYKLKLEQLKNVAASGDDGTAAQIADTINWRKVRSVSTLCMVGDIYSRLGRYDDSREMYLLAYDRSPIGRNVVYKLAENAIRAKNTEEAEEYYNEFAELAVNDTKKYILRYQISCLKNEPVANRISILEELKEQEYTEEWAYELARLYAEAGDKDRCAAACDELILWFGDGEYVEKALNLKSKYRPLSAEQEEKYWQIIKRQANEKVTGKPEGGAEAPQEAAVKEGSAAGKAAPAGEEGMPAEEKKMSAAGEKTSAAGERVSAEEKSAPASEGAEGETPGAEKQKPEAVQKPLQSEKDQAEASEPEALSGASGSASGEAVPGADNQEKTGAEPDTQRFTTMDLQAELRKSMEQIMHATEKETVSNTMNSIKKMADDFPKLQEQEPAEPEKKVRVNEEILNKQIDESLKSDFNEFLEEDVDGQISMDVPSSPLAEEQVPGQMSIEEVLADWEKTKRAAEAAMAAAEQKKLEVAKRKAIEEAQELIRRLESMDTSGKAAENEASAAAEEKTEAAEPNPDECTAKAQAGATAAAAAVVTAAAAVKAEEKTVSAAPAGTEAAPATSESGSETAAGTETAAESVKVEAEKTEKAAEAEAVKTEPEKTVKAEKAAEAEPKAEAGAVKAEPAAEAKEKAVSEKPQEAAVKKEAEPVKAEQTAEAEAELEAEAAKAEGKADREELAEKSVKTAGEAAKRETLTSEKVFAETNEKKVSEKPAETCVKKEAEPKAAESTAKAETAVSAKPAAETEGKKASAEPAEAAAVKEAEPQLAERAAQAEEGLKAAESAVKAASAKKEEPSQEEIEANLALMEEINRIAREAADVQNILKGKISAAEHEEDEKEAEKPSAETAAAEIEKPLAAGKSEAARTAEKPGASTCPMPDVKTDAAAAGNTQKVPVISRDDLAKMEAAEAQTAAAEPAGEKTDAETEMAKKIEPEEIGGGVTLNEEQRALFRYFLPVPGMEEQILRVMTGAVERGHLITSNTGNIIIQGPEGSGKTVLAASLIKCIQDKRGEKDKKIGKISAKALNKKNFAALIPKLDGGYLIIEKAGDLSAEAMERMSQVMEGNTRGLVVVMEDSKSRIHQMLKQNYSFSKKFTETITIPIFTIDELVDFGRSYAEEMECTIDEMGILALYNRINNIQKLDKATTLTEVREIVDGAIEKAEKGGLKKFFSKKYDENDYLILHEKDFEA